MKRWRFKAIFRSEAMSKCYKGAFLLRRLLTRRMRAAWRVVGLAVSFLIALNFHDHIIICCELSFQIWKYN